MLKNFSVSFRIALVGGLALAGLLLIALLAFVSLQTLAGQATRTVQQDFALLRAVAGVEASVGALRRFERDFFLHIGDEGALAEDRQRWEETLTQTLNTLAGAEKLAEEEAQRQGVQSLRADIDAYAGHFRRIADDVLAGKLAGPADGDAAMNTYRRLLRRIDSQVAEMIAAGQMQSDASAAGLAQTRSRAVLMLGGGVLLVVAAAVILMLWIGRSIAQPLQATAGVARRIVEEDDLTLQAPECGRCRSDARPRRRSARLPGALPRRPR